MFCRRNLATFGSIMDAALVFSVVLFGADRWRSGAVDSRHSPLATVVTGGIILLTGWTRVDPILCLIVVAVVLVGSWCMMRD